MIFSASQCLQTHHQGSLIEVLIQTDQTYFQTTTGRRGKGGINRVLSFLSQLIYSSLQRQCFRNKLPYATRHASVSTRAMPRYPCKPSVSLHHPSPHHNRRDSIRSLSPFQPNNKKKKSGYTNCSSQQRTDYCIIRKGEKVVITVNTNQKEQRRKKSSLARSSRALGSPLTPSCHSSTTARDLPARGRQTGTRPSVARSSCWR